MEEHIEAKVNFKLDTVAGEEMNKEIKPTQTFQMAKVNLGLYGNVLSY